MFNILNRTKDKPIDNKSISIAVWSPTGAGASTVAASLFLYLIKATDKRITIVDADIYKPELDSILDIDITPKGIKQDKLAGSLNYLCDSITKDSLNTEIFEELIIDYKKTGSVITGNTSLSDCESIWCGDEKSNFFRNTGMDSFVYYETLHKKAMECSQIVIYDLATSMFMDSTKFFLNTADYALIVLSAKQSKIRAAKSFIEHAKQHFLLDNYKTFLMVNKYSAENMDKQKMKEIFKGWTFLRSHLGYEPKVELAGAKGIEVLSNNDAFQELSERLNIVKEKKLLDYIREKVKGGNKPIEADKDENNAVNF